MAPGRSRSRSRSSPRRSTVGGGREVELAAAVDRQEPTGRAGPIAEAVIPTGGEPDPLPRLQHAAPPSNLVSSLPEGRR